MIRTIVIHTGHYWSSSVTRCTDLAVPCICSIWGMPEQQRDAAANSIKRTIYMLYSKTYTGTECWSLIHMMKAQQLQPCCSATMARSYVPQQVNMLQRLMSMIRYPAKHVIFSCINQVASKVQNPTHHASTPPPAAPAVALRVLRRSCCPVVTVGSAHLMKATLARHLRILCQQTPHYQLACASCAAACPAACLLLAARLLSPRQLARLCRSCC